MQRTSLGSSSRRLAPSESHPSVFPSTAVAEAAAATRRRTHKWHHLSSVPGIIIFWWCLIVPSSQVPPAVGESLWTWLGGLLHSSCRRVRRSRGYQRLAVILQESALLRRITNLHVICIRNTFFKRWLQPIKFLPGFSDGLHHLKYSGQQLCHMH